MITAIVHHIKECKYVVLGFLISVAVAFLACHMHALHTDNHKLQTDNRSFKIHLQSAENENAQITKSFKEQLQSVESTNERLADDKKEIQKKIDQISAELQSIKDKYQKLLEEKQGFQKKLDQNDVELQSVKDNNQKLLEEKQGIQKKLDQNNAELQSIKSNNQLLLEEKIKLLEKINENNAEHGVYNTQLLYIQKWMDCIDKLEEHINAMIHCSESKKKGSLYSQAKFCSKISYDFDERYAGEVIVKASDLNMEFKKECRKFLDALLLKELEVMKTQQRESNMEDIKNKMEKLIKEVSDDKYRKKKEPIVKKRPIPEEDMSKEKAVQKDGILTTIYKFGNWVVGMVAGLFWS